MNRARGRGDAGASLVIALGIVAVLGLCLPSILDLAGVGFRTTVVAQRNRTDLYAADGGIDYGIQTVRASSSICSGVSSTPQSLPNVVVNGDTVGVTCQTQSGGGSGGGSPLPTSAYALVATGYGLAPSALNQAISTSGSTGHAGDTINISGAPVFSAGGFSFSGGTPSFVIEKDLHQYNYPSPSDWCSKSQTAAASSGNPLVGGTWTCEPPASFAVPDPNPAPVVPTANAFAPSSVTCKDSVGGATGTVLFPGKYTSATKPTFSGSGRYYLASGTYYFENTGSMTLKGSIFGGMPLPPEAQTLSPASASPCADDAMANALHAGAATGNGVQIILGGSSALNISNTSSERMEFFTRNGGPGTDGVSIYAEPSTASTLPANYVASTVASPLVTNGTAVQLVIHGMVYLPWNSVRAWALSGAQGGAQFTGGLVARDVLFAVNAGSGSGALSGLQGSVPTPPVARSVVITSTAGSTTAKAVVTIDVDANKTTTIQSWRKWS